MHDSVAIGTSNKDVSHAQSFEFSATLLPHRSLTRKGFVVLMLAVAVVSLLCGIGFFVVGAWPVTGFLGLDVLLIYFAFRLNYRNARMYEQVDLTENTLTVTRVSVSGRSRSYTFNPYWVRFQLLKTENAPHQLVLSSHGRYLIFGQFLSDEEKESFAKALSCALSNQKQRGI